MPETPEQRTAAKFDLQLTAAGRLVQDKRRDVTISIEPEELELSPFNQRGGLGKAHQLLGEQQPKLLDQLNTASAV